MSSSMEGRSRRHEERTLRGASIPSSAPWSEASSAAAKGFLFCFILGALLSTAHGQIVTVLNFQPEGLPTRDTYALYRGNLSREYELHSLTLCFRFNFHYLHASATVIKLEDSVTGIDESLVGILWIDRIRTMLGGLRKFQPLKKEFRANRWHHVCFLYNDEEEWISSFVDGKFNYKDSLKIPGVASGDTVWLGQGAKVGVDETSFSGLLTQVNVWDYVLSEEEVVGMAKCDTDPQGNYVAWNIGWTLMNIVSYEEDLSTICQLEGTRISYQWFSTMSQDEAYYLCEALGGTLPEISDVAGAELYHAIAATTWPNEKGCKTKFWTGLTDIDVDGEWRHATSPHKQVNLFWAGGEPDGIFYQNCALIYPEGMRDVNCPVTFKCAVCEHKSSTAFSLRGTCETDKRHVYFTSHQPSLGEIQFRGYGGYYIIKEDGLWVWRERKGEAIIATLEPTQPDFPLGRRRWNLQRSMCSQEPGARVLLFSPCGIEDFTCDDAKCISLEKRCDLKYDCHDHSDEVDCHLIKFPAGYQYDLPPRQTSLTESVLPVVANITIKSITVDTMLMSMFVSYEFEMTWYDNRLKYLNFKKKTSLNILPYDQVREVWSPAVSFSNTEGGHSTVVDIKTAMFITRLANSTGRDLSVPAELEIYSGFENILSINRKYATLFTCDFNLILYPFDDQYCDMLLQLSSASTAYIRFNVPDSYVKFLGNPLLLEYEMSDPELHLGGDWEYSQLIVRVPLSRRFGYAVLNIYTPSFILLVISYVTLHFQPHIFDVRVMSVLTVLLVTATLFTQVSSSLPKTSYFKMVDIWLLFCIVMNFIIILLHAIVDYTYHVERSNITYWSKKTMTEVKPLPELKTLHDKRMAAYSEDEEPPTIPFDIRLKTMVMLSKAFVLMIFVVFSFCYWGYILF
uniref:Glycine receptor subunit alpha-2-like n=1 Tax=Hirondellea gigas TaxID=1518452 RepID=A0A6A7FW06_9CRUS